MTFVVNRSSGGGEAVHLARRLQLHGVDVHDIRRDNLADLVTATDGMVVACGGDGTASAVLDAVAKSGRDVPVAIVPLGTGNDLARHLGWPLSEMRWEDMVRWLTGAPAQRLDRWLLEGPGVSRSWFNYWSMGADAAIVHRFDQLRRVQPWLMRGGSANKALYGVCGLQERGSRLGRVVTSDFPSGASSIVAANIPSYAGGLRLGSRIRADDGRLDLFALPGGIALGLVIARRRRARDLGQHVSLDFTLHRSVPMQIDGEPLRAAAGEWRLRRHGQVRVLAGPLNAEVRAMR